MDDRAREKMIGMAVALLLGLALLSLAPWAAAFLLGFGFWGMGTSLHFSHPGFLGLAGAFFGFTGGMIFRARQIVERVTGSGTRNDAQVQSILQDSCDPGAFDRNQTAP